MTPRVSGVISLLETLGLPSEFGLATTAERIKNYEQLALWRGEGRATCKAVPARKCPENHLCTYLVPIRGGVVREHFAVREKRRCRGDSTKYLSSACPPGRSILRRTGISVRISISKR